MARIARDQCWFKTSRGSGKKPWDLQPLRPARPEPGGRTGGPERPSGNPRSTREGKPSAGCSTGYGPQHRNAGRKKPALDLQHTGGCATRIAPGPNRWVAIVRVAKSPDRAHRSSTDRARNGRPGGSLRSPNPRPTPSVKAANRASSTAGGTSECNLRIVEEQSSEVRAV